MSVEPRFPTWRRPAGKLCLMMGLPATISPLFVAQRPVNGQGGVNWARQADFGRTDAIDLAIDQRLRLHAGAGFGLSQSMRRRISANRSLGIATSAIWKVT